jgi:hypothetical protein
MSASLASLNLLIRLQTTVKDSVGANVWALFGRFLSAGGLRVLWTCRRVVERRVGRAPRPWHSCRLMLRPERCSFWGWRGVAAFASWAVSGSVELAGGALVPPEGPRPLGGARIAALAAMPDHGCAADHVPRASSPPARASAFCSPTIWPTCRSSSGVVYPSDSSAGASKSADSRHTSNACGRPVLTRLLLVVPTDSLVGVDRDVCLVDEAIELI